MTKDKKSIFEKVKADQEAKAKRIADLEKKVASLEKDKAEAQKAMDEARENENVAAYTKNKEAMSAANDGLEVYGENLKTLKESSLYGDKQKDVIEEMRRELEKDEEKALEAVKPYLEKILKIIEPAADDYYIKAKMVKAMYEDTDINTSEPIAWRLGNVSRSINNLLVNQTNPSKNS